jgi:hypothetical protein
MTTEYEQGPCQIGERTSPTTTASARFSRDTPKGARFEASVSRYTAIAVWVFP